MLTDFSTIVFSWELLPLKNIYCSNNGFIYCICLILNHRQHFGVTVFNCKQILPPAEVLPNNFVSCYWSANWGKLLCKSIKALVFLLKRLTDQGTYISSNKFLSNFVLFTCICTHHLWKKKKTNKQTKGQVLLGPPLGKQDIQVKEAYYAAYLLNLH